MSDYTELELYLNDGDEDKTVDLWVYTAPNKFFIINDVSNNPTRYYGWWSVPFIQYGTPASAHIEDNKVMYFVTIEKDRT